ncbi:MAG TPA: outer membrane lipoprotein carrier protein LolA [Sphingomicrobium sp.]|nr:outer membrane lipoprotein carrier protein LolA [Sphingomicrobium sp.]
MNLMSSLARALAPVAIVAIAAAPAPAATSAELQAVQASLAATQSMTADFLQTDGKGRQMAGTLSLKRPGKIRFAYGGGVDMLLVADGKRLTFVDYQVAQKSSWPIGKSPLAVLLSPQPDLGRIARIVPSQHNSVIIVRARDARRPEFGTLVLAFVRDGAAPGGLKLEGWTAIDAQNKKTTVRLSNQRYNVALPDSAFTYAEPKRKKA